MEEQYKQTAKELLSRIRDVGHNEETQAMIASLKSEFENMGSDVKLVLQRVKSPLSAYRKFNTDPKKYGKSWDRMKDIVGLMVIVDTNEDVDNVIEYITKNHAHQKNRYSSNLVHDYRYDDFRTDKGFQSTSDPSIPFDPPSKKGYQLSDGYKNVRANLSIGGYPVEIQIKTIAQYIAHEATHGIYKSPLISSQDERSDLSAKIFPYLEARAHLQFHKKELSPEEIESVECDIMHLYERIVPSFQNYPQLLDDIHKSYAVYSFIYKNRDKIFADATLGNSILSTNLVEAEVERVFNYTKKDLLNKKSELTEDEAIQETIKSMINMPYEEFCEIRQNIAHSYRLNTCVISGNWDVIRGADVNVVKAFNESFRRVLIGIYDDEMSELIMGKPPVFNMEQRSYTAEKIRGVGGTVTIDSTANVTSKFEIAPLSLGRTEEKPYAIGYLPGAYDGLHTGHTEYINKASTLCDMLIVGIKTDEYVRQRKHKEPMVNEDERLEIIEALRPVFAAYKTDNDIFPPQPVLDIMQTTKTEDKPYAVFLGSDWFKRPETKTADSLAELEQLHELQQENPNIVITNIPREDNRPSSTSLRSRILDELDDINPYEITTFEGQQ